LSNSDNISYVGAELDSDDDKKLKIETGSLVPYGVHLFSKEVVASQLWIEIEKQQL